MAEEDAGPTFEDLMFDDTLNDLERIERYATSSIALQRLVHVKMMTDVAQRFPFCKVKDVVFPLLETLVNDEEFVMRQHVAEQLRGLATVCHTTGTEDGYRCLIDTLLFHLTKLVSDSQPEVRIAAGETLVAVAEYIKPEDLGARVLTIVLKLAHDDEHEDLRMTAAVLLNELAETLGPELCHQFVTPEVICLSEDPVFRVRKATALNMDVVCRIAGPAMATERLVPAFMRLTQDDIFGVRKACAESLVPVAKALDPAIRVEQFVPVVERFVADPSKWVRAAMFQHLGAFLATLSSRQISTSLLAHFISMPALGTGEADSAEPHETHPAVYCAFSFPAVVVTLGPTRWPELKATFEALSRDSRRAVRKPLAHSLHEIAKVLGPVTAEADLLPTFHLYLRDIDDVKVGVIKSLASFLGALTPEYRESYLPILDEIQTCSNLNWRFRLLLAQQLTALTQLFSPAATCSVVTSVTIKMLSDAVAFVRETACAGVPPLLRRLAAAEEAWETDLVAKLHAFGTSKHCRERLVFLRICRELLEAPVTTAEWFGRTFQEALLALATDSVSNVRLYVAKLLTDTILPAWVRSAPAIVSTLAAMQSDQHTEVRGLAAGFSPSSAAPLAAPGDEAGAGDEVNDGAGTGATHGASSASAATPFAAMAVAPPALPPAKHVAMGDAATAPATAEVVAEGVPPPPPPPMSAPVGGQGGEDGVGGAASSGTTGPLPPPNPPGLPAAPPPEET